MIEIFRNGKFIACNPSEEIYLEVKDIFRYISQNRFEGNLWRCLEVKQIGNKTFTNRSIPICCPIFVYNDDKIGRYSCKDCININQGIHLCESYHKDGWILDLAV